MLSRLISVTTCARGKLVHRRTLSSALRPSLKNHLDLLVSRHKQLEIELEGGTAAFSAERMREMSRLSPIIALRADMESATLEMAELNELAADASAELELRQIAKAELDENAARLERLEQELIALLVPPEDGDDRNVVLEVRAGTGGLEAGLFASELLTMYERLAKRRRWRFELHDQSENDAGGTREATASVIGEGVYATLRAETGVHRVQRVPATEGLGRVHTSTVVVVVLPAADEEGGGVDLRPEDIQVDVFRSGGAGGQHVNTTESAVRLTHKPTGIKVSCQNERSQHMNKATAMKVLRARVEAHEKQLAREARDALRADVASTGARSERIRTYNFADDRVTDHRLGESKYGIPRMLAGELLEELVEDLAMKHALEKREEFLRALEDA